MEWFDSDDVYPGNMQMILDSPMNHKHSESEKKKNFSLDSHCLLFSHISVIVQSWSRPYLNKLRHHAFEVDRGTGQAYEAWWLEVTGFTLLIWKF